jgi:hypothetical protein
MEIQRRNYDLSVPVKHNPSDSMYNVSWVPGYKIFLCKEFSFRNLAKSPIGTILIFPCRKIHVKEKKFLL